MFMKRRLAGGVPKRPLGRSPLPLNDPTLTTEHAGIAGAGRDF
jgi:hypothetical protein